MTSPIFNVLFICTGNSARSIMAEAIMNQQSRGHFRAFSAGSHPVGQLSPAAVDLLQRHHFDTSQLRSKNWREFASTEAPKMDFVLTVCDKAAGEVCPAWPGQPISAHWGIEDPVAVQGDEAQTRKAFSDAFMTLQRRIALFLNLPLDKLDKLSLQNELNRIGTQQI